MNPCRKILSRISKKSSRNLKSGSNVSPSGERPQSQVESTLARENRRETSTPDRNIITDADTYGGSSTNTVRDIIRVLQGDNHDDGAKRDALIDLCNALLGEEIIGMSVADVESLISVIVNIIHISEETSDYCVRAMNCMCRVSPDVPSFIVQNGAIPLLCNNLFNIADIILAEESLRCLEILSHRHGPDCLEENALIATLQYVDFFASELQETALSAVYNMCQHLSEDTVHYAMDVLPLLTTFLGREDVQILETVTTCFVHIVEASTSSEENYNRFCLSGLFYPIINLLSDAQPQSLQSSAIRLLSAFIVKFPSSTTAMVEVDILKNLENMLVSRTGAVQFYINQRREELIEIISLASSLLPSLPKSISEEEEGSDGEGVTDILIKFEALLPVLVQLFNQCGTFDVRRGCLEIFKKFMWFCKDEKLAGFLDTSHIPSILVSTLRRRESDEFATTLEALEILLKRDPESTVKLFVKEGVLEAIEKLEEEGAKDYKGMHDIISHANFLKDSYFYSNSDVDMCAVSNRLIELSKELNDFVMNPGGKSNGGKRDLPKVLADISLFFTKGKEVSAFELEKSGIISSLLKLFGKHCLKQEMFHMEELKRSEDSLLRRLQIFLECFLKDYETEEFALTMLVRRLQDIVAWTTRSLQKLFESTKNRDLTCLMVEHSSFSDRRCFQVAMLDTTCDAVLLLKILERVNRKANALKAHSKADSFANGNIDSTEEIVIKDASVPQEEFISPVLASQLSQKLMMDGNVVDITSWLLNLAKVCPFLFPFDLRQKIVASILALSKNGDKEITVERNNIFDSATIEAFSKDDGVLKVQFHEEKGGGRGPTIEFWSLMSHEFQKKSYGMWRDLPHSKKEEEDTEDSNGEFVESLYGLFPRPYLRTSVEPVKDKFSLLGKVMAKAIKDGMLIDLPLSRAFYKLVMGYQLDIYDIHFIDPDFAKTLLQMEALAMKKKVLDSKLVKGKDLEEELCYNGCKIEDLCIDFTLPGYSETYPLKGSGENISLTKDNLLEYVELTMEAVTKEGVMTQVECFKQGFNQILPLISLKMFAEDELDILFCGEQSLWDKKSLRENVTFLPEHYSQSIQAEFLIDIMDSLTYKEQRALLKFVTGSPRLPIGGMAALCPKFTVAKKDFSVGSVFNEADFPSTMTCSNYLKLPPYSTKEIMRERILFAINDAHGSFYFS